jgi:uncharacterized protein (DUF4415 family)
MLGMQPDDYIYFGSPQSVLIHEDAGFFRIPSGSLEKTIRFFTNEASAKIAAIKDSKDLQKGCVIRFKAKVLKEKAEIKGNTITITTPIGINLQPGDWEILNTPIKQICEECVKIPYAGIHAHQLHQIDWEQPANNKRIEEMLETLTLLEKNPPKTHAIQQEQNTKVNQTPTFQYNGQTCRIENGILGPICSIGNKVCLPENLKLAAIRAYRPIEIYRASNASSQDKYIIELHLQHLEDSIHARIHAHYNFDQKGTTIEIFEKNRAGTWEPMGFCNTKHDPNADKSTKTEIIQHKAEKILENYITAKLTHQAFIFTLRPPESPENLISQKPHNPQTHEIFEISTKGKLIIKDPTIDAAMKKAARDIRENHDPKDSIEKAASQYGLEASEVAQALSFKNHVENKDKETLQIRISKAVLAFVSYRDNGKLNKTYKGEDGNIIIPPILNLEAHEAIRHKTQDKTHAQLLFRAYEMALNIQQNGKSPTPETTKAPESKRETQPELTL